MMNKFSQTNTSPAISCCSLANLLLLLLYSLTGLHFVEMERPDTDFMKIYMGTIFTLSHN